MQLDNNKTVVGTFQLIDSSMISEITDQAGLDFVILDQENGPSTAEMRQQLVASAEGNGEHSVIGVFERTPKI